MIRILRYLRFCLRVMFPGWRQRRAYAVQEMYLENFYFTRRRSRNCWWR